MWNSLTDKEHDLPAILASLQGWLLPLLLVLTTAVCIFIVWQIRRASADETAETIPGRLLKLFNVFLWLRFISAEIVFLLTSRKQNYKQPWYLLLGTSDDSGKNKLLVALNDELKPHLTSREKSFSAQSCRWNFFNPGVLINIDDTLFRENDIDTDKKKWGKLIEQIQDYRPERPIDGIIINLSALQLKSASNSLSLHLSYLRESLWQLQQQYDFALPVYFIINHCDSIEGFNAFCSAIPESQQQQIFGWSNSARTGEAMNLSVVNDGLTEMQDILKGLILAIAASDIELSDTETDELMQFPYDLSTLQKTVIDITGKLFKHTDPNSAFFIRGIYFSGQAKKQNKPSFVEELFIDKIFAEKNLAYPTSYGSLSLNRRLRRFKYLSALILLTLIVVAKFEYNSLENQVTTIEVALDDMDAIETLAPNDGNMVYPLLLKMADMDAGELTRWSMPLSKLMSLDTRISQYLSDNKFTKIIFPRIEERLKQRGNHLLDIDKDTGLSTNTPDQPFKNWLDQLQESAIYLHKFEELVKINNSADSNKALNQFTELAEYLYQQNLTEKFTQHSDLYRKALAKSCYPKINDKCDTINKKFHSHKLELLKKINWQLLDFAEKTQQALISNSYYGGGLFATLEQLNASPTASNLLNIQQDLQGFSAWYDQQQQNWTGEEDPCQSIQQHLKNFKSALEKNNIHQLTNIDPGIDLFDKEKCSKPALEKLASAEYPVFSTLLANTDTISSPVFKSDIITLREAIPRLQQLGFYTVGKETNLSYIGENYFWDYKQLNKVTTFYSDYESFLEKQHNKDSKGSSAAQDIARNLLHHAMKTVILNARLGEEKAKATLLGLTPIKRAVSAEQQLLAQKIRQFKPSMQALAELPGLFNQLGFIETADEVNTLTRNYSMDLLKSVDAIANNSQLYAVRKRLLWMQPNMVSALFGISKPELLKAYLFSQREASKNLALNYATPALQFLLNSDYPFQQRLNSDDQLLFSRWYETSIQINKSEQPDPNNGLQKLEDFFNNQLSDVNQSNCFGYSFDQGSIDGVDLFSTAQRDIIGNAENYCKKYNIDVIKKEYASLAREFNTNLRGKFPFSNSNDSVDVNSSYENEATYAAVHAFFQNYQTNFQGINNRIVLLAKKDSRYNKTRLFLDQLQQAADFFSTNLTTATQFDKTAISTRVEFRTKVIGSKTNPQIVHWLLSTAGQSISSPGADNFLNWFFAKDITLKLRWSNTAKTAPVEQQDLAIALQPIVNEAEKTAKFEYRGNWALLRFIVNHRSNIKDPRLPANNQQTILSFAINQLNNSDGSDAATTQAYMRLALYKTNPETGTVERLTAPDQFPVSAPEISAKANRQLSLR